MLTGIRGRLAQGIHQHADLIQIVPVASREGLHRILDHVLIILLAAGDLVRQSEALVRRLARKALLRGFADRVDLLILLLIELLQAFILRDRLPGLLLQLGKIGFRNPVLQLPDLLLGFLQLAPGIRQLLHQLGLFL